MASLSRETIRGMVDRITMPKIETIDQARKVYFKFDCYPNVNESKRDFALAKWNEFFLPLAKKIATIEDPDEFFNSLASCSLPPGGEAYNILCEGFNNMLPKILTPRQAGKYHGMFSRESKFINCLDGKWEEVSQAAAEEASTIGEFKAYIDIIRIGRQSNLLISKWIVACQTIQEIEEMTESTKSKLGFYSDLKKAIINRTDLILLDEVPKAKDLETIKHYYDLASEQCAARILAFEKWLELCTNKAELNEAHNKASGEKCRLLAYNRIKHFESPQS